MNQEQKEKENQDAQKRQTPQSKQIQEFQKVLELIDKQDVKDYIQQEIKFFQNDQPDTSEWASRQSFLKLITRLPWQKYSKEIWDLKYASKLLDDNIYGLRQVKKRILEMMAVNKLKASKQQNQNPDDKNNFSKGLSILLTGPPGTGKTTIAKLIAKALQRECRVISLAGATDTSFFKGHLRTYVDSQPGIFIKEIIKAKTKNPVFVLDEIDKMGSSYRGNPYFTLLEILNQEENMDFKDHYLQFGFDFSNVIFILTSNDVFPLIDPLINRLEIIEVSSYIDEEKLQIAKKYLLPDVLKSHGLKQDQIQFDNKSLLDIIQGWCYYEAGVRELKRCLQKISRKWIKEMTKISQTKLIFDGKQEKNLKLIKKYLGNPIFDPQYESVKNKKYPPGKTNILSVSGYIGTVLQVESIFDKTNPSQNGNLTFSGNLQKVLEESLQIAKLNAFDFFTTKEIKIAKNNNVHIHLLNASSKKDGPSAGMAICMAYYSLISGKPISANIGMTGELSLSGHILPIGGVQQKVQACKKVGINKVIFSVQNMSEYMKLPQNLRQDITAYFVSHIKEAHALLFEEDKNQKDVIDSIIVVKN